MNARSRFTQSAIPNGHTACGPIKKTVVRGKKRRKKKKKKKRKKRRIIAHNAQLAVLYRA